MSVELSDLLGTRTLEVPFAGQTITVTYKLAERTPAAMEAAVDTKLVKDDLPRLLESWDLMRDGAPLPVTVESVNQVPLPALQAIYMAIVTDDGLGEVSSSSGAS
jgi:hypothetical protein